MTGQLSVLKKIHFSTERPTTQSLQILTMTIDFSLLAIFTFSFFNYFIIHLGIFLEPDTQSKILNFLGWNPKPYIFLFLVTKSFFSDWDFKYLKVVKLKEFFFINLDLLPPKSPKPKTK